MGRVPTSVTFNRSPSTTAPSAFTRMREAMRSTDGTIWLSRGKRCIVAGARV